MATDKDDEILVHPEIITPADDPGGLYCFLDAKRGCSADCMAYVTFPRKGKEAEVSDQQAHCELVLAAERASRHIALIASVLTDTQRKQRIREADEQRTKAAGPPLDPRPKS